MIGGWSSSDSIRAGYMHSSLSFAFEQSLTQWALSAYTNLMKSAWHLEQCKGSSQSRHPGPQIEPTSSPSSGSPSSAGLCSAHSSCYGSVSP